MVVWMTSKVMLKTLQVRFQHSVSLKLSIVPGGFRKGRGTRDQSVGSDKMSMAFKCP